MSKAAHCIPGEEDEVFDMNPLRYPSGNDASMRLLGTIVRYKGEPVYISDVPGQNQATATYLKDNGKGAHFHINPNDDQTVDISSVPLGYMTHNSTPYYLQRVPERRQKQGLDTRRVIIRKDKSSMNLDQTLNGYWRDLNNTILDIGWRPLTAALSAGGAINRYFAVEIGSDKIRKFCFMGETIGFFRTGTNRVFLNKTYRTPHFIRLVNNLGIQT